MPDRHANRSDEAPTSLEGGIRIVMNRGSGKRRGDEAVGEIERLIGAYPGRIELRSVARGSEIEAEARRAVESGIGTVVAAGGDGTICAVASALAGTDRRMGILPLGTFNFFARSLGLPETLAECLEIVMAGHACPVKIGEVNGRVFLNNASLGAYPAILKRREDVYRRWGRSRAAAYWSVLTTLIRFRRPLLISVDIDGKSRDFRTPLVFAASNPYQLEHLGMDGVDCTRNGALALFIAPDRRGFELVRSALRLARGAAVRHEDFEMLCGDEFTVTTLRAKHLVARDGEKNLLRGPFRFVAKPGALNVLTPPDGDA